MKQGVLWRRRGVKLPTWADESSCTAVGRDTLSADGVYSLWGLTEVFMIKNTAEKKGCWFNSSWGLKVYNSYLLFLCVIVAVRAGWPLTGFILLFVNAYVQQLELVLYTNLNHNFGVTSKCSWATRLTLHFYQCDACGGIWSECCHLFSLLCQIPVSNVLVLLLLFFLIIFSQPRPVLCSCVV